MNHKKIYSIIFVIIILLITACSVKNNENKEKNVEQETMSTITFNEKFIKISDKTTEALAENIQNVGTAKL